MAAKDLHQTIVGQLREQPSLVVALLRTVRTDVSADAFAAGVTSALSPSTTDLHPDALIELRATSGAVERVVIVEVQLDRLADKPYTLPVYQTLARRRHRVPCDVLVLTLDDRVASELRRPMSLGHGSVFRAIVVTHAELATLESTGSAELAFLRALAVAREDPMEVLAAAKAFDDLPDRDGVLYLDLILQTLPDAIREAAERLMEEKGYELQSRWLRSLRDRSIEQGLEQGREQGLEQGREQGLEQGREQGLEQGREQGLEQGREQGLEQGREQGLEQGREQGRVEAREAILCVIRTLLHQRGITLSVEDEGRLTACDDITLLTRWTVRAATATSGGDVFDSEG